MGKKQKIRAEFRKQHQGRTRKKDLTRDLARESLTEDDLLKSERVSGKGELTRKRTVIGQEADSQTTGLFVRRDVDAATTLPGRVLSVHGLASSVRTDDGRMFQCATRRLLKNLNTGQRHVVAAGDVVYFRPESATTGLIERIEPRTSILSRTSKQRQHVIVTNVDQLFIVASAAEPHLKPNLIDRFLVEAERLAIEPVICINKIDLVEPADLLPLAGVYGQMGYEVLLLSAATGVGVAKLRRLAAGKESVFAGQSGVGKSSLLNAIEPNLALKVREVSRENQKGKHTTTVARLIPLAMGGYVVDTPGIRQFQLWDIIPEEVAGYYRDLRPHAGLCRFPNCTHTHEVHCAVKDAVADGRLDVRRYESYCHLRSGDME
ncbi:MAG: ribosome small subunit-dependent GTPase A [Pirellulaceae bacterium]